MPNNCTHLGAATTALAEIAGVEMLGIAIGGLMPNILHAVVNTLLEARG